MHTAELVLRVAAFTELIVLVAVLLPRVSENHDYGYAALLFTGIAAYFLAPLVLLDWDWGWAGYPVILLAIMVPVLFWYFVKAVFNDDAIAHPRVKWLALATALLGLLALATGRSEGFTSEQTPANYLGWIIQIVKLMWLTAAFVALLRDWRADLVESRRRLRRLIVFAAGCYIGAVLVVELLIPDPVPSLLELVNVSLLLLIVSALCLQFLKLNETNVLARLAAQTTAKKTARSALAQQVVDLMEQQRVFASEALTINSLADRMRMQASQLRLVINGELGYRNFNDFVNRYRIQEIANRLSEGEYRKTPLLTLALEAGFRSLAPFNRSFKAHFGVTPSEYRRNLES